MNRRGFLGFLGVGATAVAVGKTLPAPKRPDNYTVVERMVNIDDFAARNVACNGEFWPFTRLQLRETGMHGDLSWGGTAGPYFVRYDCRFNDQHGKEQQFFVEWRFDHRVISDRAHTAWARHRLMQEIRARGLIVAEQRPMELVRLCGHCRIHT